MDKLQGNQKTEYIEIICKQGMLQFMTIFDKLEELDAAIDDVMDTIDESYSVFEKCAELEPGIDIKTGFGWPVALESAPGEGTTVTIVLGDRLV